MEDSHFVMGEVKVLVSLASVMYISCPKHCATDDDSCIAIKTFSINHPVRSRASEVLHQVDHVCT